MALTQVDGGLIASGQTITSPTLSSPVTAGTPTGVGVLTSGTAVASTSGTSIDFTSIPSWVKRITVMLNAVSTNSTSAVQIQIGSSTFSTSGYQSNASHGAANGTQYVYATSGFVLDPSGSVGSAASRSGAITLSLIGSNTWVGSGAVGSGSTYLITNAVGGVSPALSGTLDRVRITTVNGTDTFDAGSINILYE